MRSDLLTRQVSQGRSHQLQRPRERRRDETSRSHNETNILEIRAGSVLERPPQSEEVVESYEDYRDVFHEEEERGEESQYLTLELVGLGVVSNVLETDGHERHREVGHREQDQGDFDGSFHVVGEHDGH